MNEQMTVKDKVGYILYRMTFPVTRNNLWFFWKFTLCNIPYKIKNKILYIKFRKLRKSIAQTQKEVKADLAIREKQRKEEEKRKEEERKAKEILLAKEKREEERENRKDAKENITLITTVVALVSGVIGVIGKVKKH